MDSTWSKKMERAAAHVAALVVILCGLANAEVLDLLGANWAGDINTQGGLDARMSGDEDTVVTALDYAGYGATAQVTVTLGEDYSTNAWVEFALGYRLNLQQTGFGAVLWDGRLVCACHPHHPYEQLRVKKVLLSTAEFDFSAGTHILSIVSGDAPGDNEGFFEVDAVQVTRIGQLRLPAAAPWLVVTSGAETEPETENRNKLTAELSDLLGTPVQTVTDDALTPAQKEENHLLLVGQYADHALIQEILDAEGHGAPFASDPAYVQEQGYVVGVYPDRYGSGRKVYVASGWGALGAVYAMSHVRTHVRALGNNLYLAPETSPASNAALYNEYRPDFEARGVYYNIAYGISFGSLTPDNWTESQWEYWVDRCVLAQLTHISYFLWGNMELDFPKSTILQTRNRQLRQRLQHMIAYAHQRGLKVVYLISATLVPQDIFDANTPTVPTLKAGSVYANDYGYPVVCQAETATLHANGYTWDGAMDLMRDVCGTQIDYFREADEFQIWFYDVGGCWCDTSRYNCRGLQPARMMEQVDAITELAMAANPQAKITVSMWPVKLLEEPAYIGWQYGDDFLDLLKTYFESRYGMGRISVLDTEYTGSSYLPEAGARGFELDAFVFPTNVETGYPFTVPMLSYLRSAASRSKDTLHTQGVHFHRNEEGGKYPLSYFISRYLWDHAVTREAAVRSYAGWVANTDATSAEELYQALVLLDEFTYSGTAGQDQEAKGARIRDLVESALSRLPAARQAEMEFLLTTARVMALYGEAAEHPGDEELYQALYAQYAALLQASPSYGGFAPAASLSRFKQHVDWLRAGWAAGAF